MGKQNDHGITWVRTVLPDKSVHPGFTYNCWWGCVEEGPACDHCYAATFSRRLGNDLWGREQPRKMFKQGHWDELGRMSVDADKLGAVLRVFVMSMGDLFEFNERQFVHPEGGTTTLDAQRDRLFDAVEEFTNLDFLLLTKRPQNMIRMTQHRWPTRWPDNVVAMATVEMQSRLWKVEKLLQVPARRHMLSMEPLLGAVNLGDYAAALDGVIVGGESGQQARPSHPDWFRSLRDQCAVHDCCFHFKQWGEWVPANGEQDRGAVYAFDDGQLMVRAGKKNAGRLLDGQLHDCMPGREWE